MLKPRDNERLTRVGPGTQRLRCLHLSYEDPMASASSSSGYSHQRSHRRESNLKESDLPVVKAIVTMATDFRSGTAFPRRGREEYGGFYWLVRVFDKARASRNGTIHDYTYP